MQDVSADIADKEDVPRWFPVWAVASILNRSHETIRTWVKTNKVPSKRDHTGAILVDGKAATLYHEQTTTRQRKSRVSVVDSVKPSKPSSVLQSYAQKRPGPPSRTGLSCVQGREVAITDQTPETQQEIVIPVRLDFTQAEKDLGEFSQHITSTLAAAVATGLGVHSLTVAMVAPADNDL